MASINNNSLQGSHDDQDKSKNHENQRNEIPPEKERLKKIKKIGEQDNDEKFSPSEDKDYDAEDYVTD